MTEHRPEPGDHAVSRLPPGTGHPLGEPTLDVSVIVPVRNEAAVIAETGAAILDQRFDGSMEVLFVEGRSDDDTRAILERLAAEDPKVRILDNPRRQLPTGMNVGLAAARGEFVAKMDAHTLFPPDYVAAGVERLRRGDVDWVSGPPVPYGTNPWSRRVALALGSRLGVGGSAKWALSEGHREVELDTGVFAGLWRRSTLWSLGGWDEDWPVNEDSELASRYLAAGRRIVAISDMAARYLPRDSLEGLARQYARYGFHRARTARRHPASLRLSHLLPVGLVAVAPGAALSGRAGAGPRLLLALYGAILFAEGARLGSQRSARDAAALPAVFAAMHLSWGAGFLYACAREGVPTDALRAALRQAAGRLRR